MNGLAPAVSKIFEPISKLDCIKPFVLVGGTALSIQIGNRLSEDLDFMRWKTGRRDTLEVGWPNIKRQLETIGHIDDIDILGLDQVLFVVDGVKLSFYAAPRTRIPSMQEISVLNNLRVADIASIGAMKMETMMRRSKFRDYYDIYSILREGADFKTMITAAMQHSGYALKEKNLLGMLATGSRFREENSFKTLSPAYEVSAHDIQEYLLQEIKCMGERERMA